MVRIEELDRIDDDEPQPVPQRQSTSRRRPPPADAQDEDETPSAVPLVDADEVARLREEYQPTPMEKFMAIAKSLLLRAMVVYFVMSFIRGNGKPSNVTTTGTSGDQKVVSIGQAENAFPNGTAFDLYVYLNERNDIVDFVNDRLIWKQEGLIYGDWLENDGGFISMTTDVDLSEKVRLRNGSIYVHTYVVPIGNDPSVPNKLRVYSSRMVNKFKKKKYAKTKNLLTGETTTTLEDQEKSRRMDSEIISHWHSNLTVNIVTDWTMWSINQVPAPLNQYVTFLVKEKKYLPVLFYNDYWNLLKDYQPISAINKTVSITLSYQPLSLFKWQLYAAQTMRNQWTMMAAGDEDDDQDTLKEAMIDTNPYLLGLTFVVSILHSIFEFLAFKNDIQFWNNRKSLEGLSVRSVFFNVFQSLIVLLYVLDNETNFVIRVSVFVGLAIEIWKINKVTDISISHENKWFGIIPRVSIQDKGSYLESETKTYDRLAFRYLSWICFPLLIAYSIYSLIYQEHKGIYSFTLGIMYGYLLAFGFIMMTPQLFINYKLKSVAHLPWRMLSYKALNTFIDDLFAFVIKMPTMYRIGCLRDDVIFFVYLYQKWIYPVDKSRVNEFGFCADETGAVKVNGEVVPQKTVSDKKKD